MEQGILDWKNCPTINLKFKSLVSQFWIWFFTDVFIAKNLKNLIGCEENCDKKLPKDRKFINLLDDYH